MIDPYYEENGIVIYNGDSRVVLASLPAESVNCVVTSPPYFGLRDYGTAKWEGGKAECDHQGPPMRTKANVNKNTGAGTDVKNATHLQFYPVACGKCGATRIDLQIGLESSPEEYVANLVTVFREVRRVLRGDGTLWLNIGDSYSNDGKWGGSTGGKHVSALRGKSNGLGRGRQNTGLKPKDLIGIPWMVAFALRADGWYLRSDIIWSKPNPMPESVTDRPTKSHEYLFLFSKSERYFYNADAIKEPTKLTSFERYIRGVGSTHKNLTVPGRTTHTIHRTRSNGVGYPVSKMRNKRSVWTVSPEPYPGAHFATFPPALIKPCVLAGCPAGGTVLDLFAGSGTTLQVASELQCKSIAVELNLQYCELIKKRLSQGVLQFQDQERNPAI